MDGLATSFDARVLAQVLTHFLWQGTLIGLLAAGALELARPRRAQTRYACNCATLAALAVCPLVTCVYLNASTAPVAKLADGAATAQGVEFDSTHVAVSPYAPPASSLAVAVDRAALCRWIAAYRHWICGAWAIGMFCGAIHLVIGNLAIWRMARDSTPLPAQVQSMVAGMAQRMNIRRLPMVRVVDEISQAMAVGVVRPMVLLPAAWVSGLSGEMLEAVVAHELAHLRRWDLLVNLLQRVVEAVLFFHPVVWWCSRRIRAEREMCCDEAAVAALGNPVTYAKALSHLAEHAMVACEPAWALGIGGSKMVLLERIRNVLGLNSTGHGRWYGPSCATIGATVASLVWGTVLLGTGSEKTVDPVANASSAGPYGKREHGVPIGPSLNKQFVRAVTDHVARHPEILIAPKAAGDARTQRFVLGEGVNSNAGLAGTVETAPSEHRKTLLPSYTIEPPDILSINVAKVKGKQETTSKQELQPIAGEHLVAPDGQVNLGSYGQVLVAGLTLEQAKKKIEEHLSATLDNPEATVSVHSYNSKVYYVIKQGAKDGDTITRLPVTGNETVLDALSQVKGLDGMENKLVYIARPQPGGAATDAIIQINWQQITAGAATATNYQVLPGDRIFVNEKPPLERAAESVQHFIGEER